MKTKKPSKQSGKLKVRPRKVGRAAAAAEDTCDYVQKWSLLATTKGYIQVWVPKKSHDKVVAQFMQGAKGRSEKNMLRERMASLGLEWECKGICSGEWCREKLIDDGGSAKLYICECDYDV
jgi:hypothetical protein